MTTTMQSASIATTSIPPPPIHAISTSSNSGTTTTSSNNGEGHDDHLNQHHHSRHHSISSLTSNQHFHQYALNGTGASYNTNNGSIENVNSNSNGNHVVSMSSQQRSRAPSSSSPTSSSSSRPPPQPLSSSIASSSSTNTTATSSSSASSAASTSSSSINPYHHHHHHHSHHQHYSSTTSSIPSPLSQSHAHHQSHLYNIPRSDSIVSTDTVASGLTSPASTTRSFPSISAQGGIRKHSPPPPIPSFPPIPRQFLPPLEPRHYTILKEVGDGSFGTVWLADWHSELQLPPGTLPPGPSSRPEYKGKKLVAIKRMKKAFEGGWAECVKLKELKSLQSIPMHPNIIPLYDAFLLPSSKELYFVFECMEGNLYQLTKSRKGRPLASGLVASIFEQILAGLDHIHRSGFFHRDMKPENLLITTTGLADYPASSLYANATTPPEKDVVVIVKLADFGLARETASRPPYTEYVSTRWYRAPEVLLRSRDYSNPVDMWALGTILLEVLTLKPIFPGDSEVDQVFKICEILGDPSTDYGLDEKGKQRGGGIWPRGVKMAKDVGFAFPKIPPRVFASLFDANTVPPQLIDCIADLLRYEPRARLTTQQCIDHAYFREVAYRYAPYRAAGGPAKPTAPTQSYHQHSQSSSHFAPSLHNLTISTSSAVPTPNSIPSPRTLPPAHGNTPSYFKPPFQTSVESNGRPLPSAEHYMNRSGGHDSSSSSSIPHVPRHYSDASSSVLSGMSGYPIQVVSSAPGAIDASMNDQSMSPFPEGVNDASSANYPSPSASSVWSGIGAGDPNWGQVPREAVKGSSASIMSHLQPHSSATFPRATQSRLGIPQRRPSFSGSVAGSTLYDGSIFEGIHTRASSIMSFPVNYGNFDQSPSPTFPDSPSSGAQASTKDYSSSMNRQGSTQAQQTPVPNIGLGFGMSNASSPQPAPSVKSGRWGGFGKVFSGDGGHSSQAAADSGHGHTLKRTPSVASSLNGSAPMEGVTSGSSPPKSKKELKAMEKAAKAAEKASRDAERAKRDAAMAASRDRARAVMQKKTQLREAADPLHNFSNSPRLVAPIVDHKGKGRASDSISVHSSASQPGFTNKMPQIVEDSSRLNVFGSHKQRRREDDDDVHSVSSNETGQSSQYHPQQRGRTAQSISAQSISSIATSASDPERGRRHEQLAELGLTRVPSLTSLNSISSAPARQMYSSTNQSHYARTGTGHSSLESSLVRQMNGLATSSRMSERGESRGARASSPRDVHSHHERYSPYPFPNGSQASLSRQHSSHHLGATGSVSQQGTPSPQPQLPPISSFDSTALASSAASIASFQSAPVFHSSNSFHATRPSPPPN